MLLIFVVVVVIHGCVFSYFIERCIFIKEMSCVLCKMSSTLMDVFLFLFFCILL